MCINPVSLHFPHICNVVTLGFLDLWWSWSSSVPVWSVLYHHWGLFWGNEIRCSSIIQKIVSHLPCLLWEKQRKQNKLVLEGLKMFSRVEMKVFLEGYLLFLFLLIHHDNKVHWKISYALFHVQRMFMMMMMVLMMTLILMFILGCPLLAELKYCINKQIPIHESKLFWATFLGCSFNAWLSPSAYISLLLTRAISETTEDLQVQIHDLWRKNNLLQH